MLFDYKGDKFITNCDWLQYSVRLDTNSPELLCPQGYRLELYAGNNCFKQRAILMEEDGDKVLTLLWQPYSRKIAQNIMTVQVANKWLYVDGGVKTTYNLLQQIVPCVFNSIGRLDICCDFTCTDRRHGIVRKLGSGSMYVERKYEGSKFWHETDYKGRKIQMCHCLSWGAKTSKVKVKLYNKSREQNVLTMTSAGDKPWIVAQWVANDMNPTTVWRVEFSINSTGQMLIEDKPVSLENVNDGTWLYTTFAGLFAHRFTIRKKMGLRTAEHNEDPKVDFLELPWLGSINRWKTYAKNDKSHESITIVRKLMAQLDTPTCRANDAVFCSLANCILEVTDSCHLDWYFKKVYQKTALEVLREQQQGVGLGCAETLPPMTKDWL